MNEDVKRMKYSPGLFMNDSDFITEQEYHMRMRRLHNRRLHTPGIAYGLDLEIQGALTVRIKAGMALDRYHNDFYGEEQSREIMVVLDEDVTLPDNTYAPNAEVYLWLEYAELEADSSPNAGGGNLHWQESFNVLHSETAPIDEGRQVVLGKLILNVDGAIGEITYLDANNQSIRRYAGFTGKEWETGRLTLSDDAIAENKPYLDATFFIDENKSGLYVSSEHTQLTGQLEVDSIAKFHQNAIMDADLNVAGNMTVTGASTEIQTDELNIKDNIVTLNSGELSDHVSLTESGFEVDRGTGAPFRMVFDENLGRVKAGLSGLEDILATGTELDEKNFIRTSDTGESIKIKRIGNYLKWSKDGVTWIPFA